ncbi:hypothetical protein L1887_30900 [Cichorium endivia]|nr:hypothetical protein L1887_30900 [Cichorium endivia]
MIFERLQREYEAARASQTQVYGNLHSQSQLADWEFTVAQHSTVPQGILDFIHVMPHDAHPMGVLISAMRTLSVLHPDANPAVRGQDLYKSKPVRDRKIVLILGKAQLLQQQLI